MFAQREKDWGSTVVALNVGALGEEQVPPVGHALAGEGVLEILWCAGVSAPRQEIVSSKAADKCPVASACCGAGGQLTESGGALEL